MSVETIARRYATALADIVTKTGETETVKAELKSWDELINSSVDLRTAFSNPAIQHIDKENVLGALINKTNPSRTTANFLRILLENSRLTDLSAILEKFESELEVRGGMVAAEITSARELSEAEKAELSRSLAGLTGKTVKPNFKIDTDIIGGVITRIGSTVYDGSVKTQLENLKKELVNG